MAALVAALGVLIALRETGRIGTLAFDSLILAAVLVASIAAVGVAGLACARYRGAPHGAAGGLRGRGERRGEAVTSAPEDTHDPVPADGSFDQLLSAINEAILLVGAEGMISHANRAAHEMLGYTDDGLLGRPMQALLAGGEPGPEKPSAPASPREATFLRADGTALAVSYTVSKLRRGVGGPECSVYAVQNIDERKRAEQRIRCLARMDPLTKLANRMQFQHLLQRAIAKARRSRQYVALLYLDADRFKDINDSFGHAAGDASLEILARRIQAELEGGALPGRLAGDEFAVLVEGSVQRTDFVDYISKLAERLVRAVGSPFRVHGEEIFMTASIGVALYPQDGDNVIDLTRNADAALYQAKKAGGNSFEFYSSEMSTAAVDRLMLKSKLRRAFERNELRLHYQPKFGVKSGRIEGAEALIRWDLPERGLVFPSDFIPLAEESNSILQIGDWVLNRVCVDYREWQRLLPSPCRVSVNLSLRQLFQQRFLERVRGTFRAHGVSPACLEFEITETTLMEDTARTIRVLDSLYAMGLHLAIDDFGIGYSSLSALQQFPISTLKIDQSFIRDAAVDRDAAAIVATIIAMGHSLKLDVVAEGVESEAQLEFLRRHDCDYVQGHLFGDPVDAAAFGRLLVADTEDSGPHRALFAPPRRSDDRRRDGVLES